MRCGTAMTDGLFMSSRDGLNFKRWDEAFLRPSRLPFPGDHLVVNFATSAAGSLQFELQDADGKPLDGFRLEDCPEMFGDSLSRTVAWKAGNDFRELAETPVRLRVVAKDADLTSFQFR